MSLEDFEPADLGRELNVAAMYYGGVRFSEDNVIFAVAPHESVLQHLRGATMVFLETGSERAGLVHILHRHYFDFLRKGINAREIVLLLKHTIENLKPLNVVVDSRGVKAEYAFDDLLFPMLIHDTLNVAIGFNGFVVTANPVGLSSVMGSLRGVADASPKSGS